MAPSDNGARFSQTATNATSAVATQAATSGKKTYVTEISGSSDKAGALILVKDGATVIWQDRISNTAAYVKSFSVPLSASGDLTVTVDGTAIANANVAGFVL